MPQEPVRQSLHDLHVELVIGAEIGRRWHCAVEKTEGTDFTRIDWVMKRDGRPMCVAEHKGLKHLSTKWPEILYDIDKYEAGWVFAKRFGVELSLGIRSFYDRVMWVNLRMVDPERHRRWRDIPQPDGAMKKFDTFHIPRQQWHTLFTHAGEELLSPEKDKRVRPTASAEPGQASGSAD